MEKQFKKFTDNIRLTEGQENDAKTKYTGVCKALYNEYYSGEYDKKKKYLFGSYKTKTNTRPLSNNQDVDVLFKIPEETYNRFKDQNGNGPSALLQEMRGILNRKYTTTDEIKGWGKVVLVKFADNTHNIEVLPAFELEDGTFIIPNTEGGGSWESFDPREQVKTFHESNNQTNGLTADLARMIKTWVKTTSTLSYKSFTLLNDVQDFLKSNYQSGAEYNNYQQVVLDFLNYLKGSCDNDKEGHVNTAIHRAEKAINFLSENKPREASQEWRKIFGNEFPIVLQNPIKERRTRVFDKPSLPYCTLRDERL